MVQLSSGCSEFAAAATHEQLNALVRDARHLSIIRCLQLPDCEVLEQRSLARIRQTEDEVLALRAHRTPPLLKRRFRRVPVCIVTKSPTAGVEVLVLRLAAHGCKR